MNYQIITDKHALEEFIEFLPELGPSEQYYGCLFSRTKYTKQPDGSNPLVHIKSDKNQLKRFTSTKDRLFDKIWQLECPIGAYRQRDVIIPQESLALYLNVNPRDLWKATKNSALHFTKMLIDNAVLANPQAEAMSEIQKSSGKKKFRIFDLDTKEEKALKEVLSFLPEGSYHLMETRGGYHILVEPKKTRDDKSKANNWYKNIINHPMIDAGDTNSDIMCPVPGCVQGGFTPKLIKL